MMTLNYTFNLHQHQSQKIFRNYPKSILLLIMPKENQHKRHQPYSQHKILIKKDKNLQSNTMLILKKNKNCFVNKKNQFSHLPKTLLTILEIDKSKDILQIFFQKTMTILKITNNDCAINYLYNYFSRITLI